MVEFRPGTAEAKFADLIWDHAPVSSGMLAKLAETEFGWKKTTSFTVLKRLCEREIFQNEKGTVTALVSRQAYYARHSEQYVEQTFGGSLPAFLAAFGSRKKLSAQEIEELERIIEGMRG